MSSTSEPTRSETIEAASRKRYPELHSASQLVTDAPAVTNVKLRVSGEIEYDPSRGEVPIPNCVEAVIGTDLKDEETLQRISRACEKYGLEVTHPDEYAQPPSPVHQKIRLSKATDK